jgi:glyoxylase-like metal-dependent hydrolase (beta-lactamase superfamily II)
MKTVKLYLNYAGYCYANEHHAIRKGRRVKIRFHALWALIQHPERGYILFDTGYTDRFYSATKRFPNKIYALITRVEIRKEDEIVSQLQRAGIRPDMVSTIVLSHFHADHTAGLKDFPDAKIIASRTAWEYANSLARTFSFSKGVLKDLHPDDLEQRISFIEDTPQCNLDSLPGTNYDLFSDSSVIAVPLPGHAAGQFGIVLQTERKKYFLIADACWLRQSFTEGILPSPVVKLFFHSWKDFRTSLTKIINYHQCNPDVVIVPTHCYETTKELVQTQIDLDVL